MNASRVFLIALLFAFPQRVAAQTRADVCDVISAHPQNSRAWPAPLDHVVTLKDHPLPVAQGLARLASISRLRISFSAELLPVDRTVCMTYGNARVGDVIADMLSQTDLAPVAVGSDQIVIARSHAAPDSAASTGSTVFPMSPVVGTTDAHRMIAERSPSMSLVILDSTSAGWRPGAELMDVLNGNVPGMWLWSGTSGGIATSYGSTRGTSSFGISAPKILIDGIEVANPLLLGHITMDAVERIEVIRGPQGSARYGADALNGVTNIITRHDTGTAAGRLARVQLSSTIGSASTQYAGANATTQDHALRLQAGHTTRSFGLNVGLSDIGPYAPGSGTTRANADASMRMITGKAIVTGTLRYLSQSIDTTGAGAALRNIEDAGLATAFADASVTEALSLREYTAGLNATVAASERWTHSVVAGLDGYRLGGVTFDSAASATATDAVLREAGTDGLRMTLRGTSVARIYYGGSDLRLTFTGDHTRISQQDDNLPVFAPQPVLSDTTRDGPLTPQARSSLVLAQANAPATATVRTSTGVSAEMTSTWKEALSLTGAVRVERDAGGTAGTGRTSALPMLGASWAMNAGSADVKLRASFGKGMRWPTIGGLRDHQQLTRANLEPEQQSGIEAGIDMRMRRALSMQLTVFNQTATGLAQEVTLPAPERGRGPGGPRFGVALQNVGAISNRGFELQASLRSGAFSLASAGTLLRSRVLRVAHGYTGDLRPGDRPLAVPSRTASVIAGYTRQEWSASLSVLRAADWINYDRIAMTRAQSADTIAVNPRTFWKAYDGFTHLGVNATRALPRGLRLSAGVTNLLNRQIGEPDNVTIVPGRTYVVGVRAVF